MRKKMSAALWALLGLTVCIFTGVLIKYWMDGRPPKQEEETARRLVILSTYESEPNRNALRELARAYEAGHAEADIELRFVSPADFQKEICLEKDAEELSDIILCDNVMTPALVSMGIFQDLSGFVDAEKADEYLDTAYNTTVVNGKPYSVPFACDPYVIFYNKDYFKKNKMPQPETLAQLHDSLLSGRTLGNYNFGMAGKNDEDISAAFLQMVYLYGGNILDLGGEGSLLFFEAMQDFRDGRILPADMVNWNQQDLMHAFEGGMVVAVVAKLGSMALLQEENMEFDYGIMEIPYEQNQSCLFHGENAGVADAEDAQVLELLAWLTGREAAERFAELSCKLPVRVDCTYNPGAGKGLEDDFVYRERNQSTAKNSYSSWFLISEAIAGDFTQFLTTPAMDAAEAAGLMQEDVRDAVMER